MRAAAPDHYRQHYAKWMDDPEAGRSIGQLGEGELWPDLTGANEARE